MIYIILFNLTYSRDRRKRKKKMDSKQKIKIKWFIINVMDLSYLFKDEIIRLNKKEYEVQLYVVVKIFG